MGHVSKFCISSAQLAGRLKRKSRRRDVQKLMEVISGESFDAKEL